MSDAATTYVVTGGSDGIGLECASQLAAADPGCRIVLVGRNPDRTASAVGRVRAEQPSCQVGSLLCDFTDQAAVRRLADGATIRQTVLDLGYVERGEITEQQLDQALDVERMTRP